MKKASKKTLALIEKAILVEYPNARKVSHNPKDCIDDVFPIIAHYIVRDIPGANALGFNEDADSMDESYGIVAVTFVIHPQTGRIFFWQYLDSGDPVSSYGECSGELVDGTMVFEFAANSELY